MTDYSFDYSFSLKEYSQICGEVSREFYSLWVSVLAVLFFILVGALPILVIYAVLSALQITGSNITLFLAIGGGILTYIVLSKRLTPWINGKLLRFNKHPERGQYVGQISFDESGITICEEHSETKIRWTGIKDVFELTSSVGLYVFPMTYFVQNEHFLDFDEKDKFIEYCRTKIKANT